MFKDSLKKFCAVALAAVLAVTGTTVAGTPAKKADAASYKGYLAFQTDGNYYYRSNHDDSKFASYVKNGNSGDKKVAGSSFKDVSFSKSGTYTVSVSGLNKMKLKKGEKFNTLYVDTNIPQAKAKKFKFTKAVVKFDGKTVKSISNPYITPKSGSKSLQVVALNKYNAKVKSWNYTMPKKSISITYTVKVK